MPRYTSDSETSTLETLLLAALNTLSGQNAATLPQDFNGYGRLTAQVIKDVSKIRADFSVSSSKNARLCDIVGLHEMDIPHFLSRAADPKHFARMRPDAQQEYETATGKIRFIGCLTASTGEAPVFFLLYADGDTLRAYVPEKGNSFDTKAKCARACDATLPVQDLFDVAAIKSDIRRRIHYVGDTGLSPIPDAKF